MKKERTYLYGPVPSRRLGLSLGVDIVPFKTCTLNCVYCQLGRTAQTTLERKDYVPIEDIIAELKERMAGGLAADFITIGGSGEPTLHSRLGELVDRIKEATSIPVAILTNGTLFYRADVRRDCANADVVLPSFDAGDESGFRAINRPHPDLTIEKMVEGLIAFRKEYRGQIWLEVFFIEGYNTDNVHVGKLREAIGRIQPDKVHLNTAVRPTAEAGIQKVGEEKLAAIARQLGPNCEVIADFAPARCTAPAAEITQTILSILKRRPCTLDDLSSALGASSIELVKDLADLVRRGLVCREQKDGSTFYRLA